MKGNDFQRAQARVRERRNSPRLKVDPLVYLKIDPDNGGFLFDLAEGGMGIRVANPLVKSAQIRFSFLLQERQPVQGTCKICWLSETGRSAGVRFVSFPDDSRRYIRQWLRAEGSQTQAIQSPQTPVQTIPGTAGPQRPEATAGLEQPFAEARLPEEETGKAPSETNPVLQDEARKTPSSFSVFAPPPPRPDPMAPEPSAAEQSFPESSLQPSIPESPLFFLPNKSRQADESDSSGPAEPFEHIYRPGERQTSDRDSEETAALQSAVLSGSAPEERDKRKKSPVKKIWVGATLCAALACAAVLSYSYPSGYPSVLRKFHGFVSSLESQYVPQFASNQSPSRRLDRQVRRRRGAFRHRRGSRTFRIRSVFHEPSADEASATAGAATLSHQASPGMLSGPSLTFSQPAGTTENAISVFSSPHSGPFSPRMTVSMTARASNLRLGGMMPDLRNDGALVVEAAPVSVPLDVANDGAVPKRIVVDAEIGEDGTVKNVRLISSPDSRLAQAVVAAVKQWRYRPLYANGQPVEFTTRITFEFSAPRSKP